MKISPLPTLITCANLAAGFLAVLLAVQGRFIQAAILILVAAGLDLLDGAVARASDTDVEFGINLDSLADLVSFGVAPAVVLYLSSLYALPVIGVAVCLFYVTCGTLRLARFPLVKSPEYFIGLPIPPAGVVLAGLALLDPPQAFVLVSVLFLGLLMISEVPFPKPSKIPLLRRSRDKKRPSTEDL
ncbi:MAG: CDP-diacylglycerol--serine O-phosphatidyltransferase [Rubrobacteraceae bacterium]